MTQRFDVSGGQLQIGMHVRLRRNPQAKEMDDAMVIFQNAQWVVTDPDGIKSVRGRISSVYEIAMNRIFETTQRGSEKFYEWPLQLAGKTWVDVELFNEAFEQAIRHCAAMAGTQIDEEMLKASYLESILTARRFRRRSPKQP